MAEYSAKLGGHHFEFEAHRSDSLDAGSVTIDFRMAPGVGFLTTVDYRDLREFARAAMDAMTDALVAGAIAEGKVPA